MEWLYINWYYVGGALLTIGGGVFTMLKFLHKIFVKNPIAKLRKDLDEQGNNYKDRFGLTHEKIDDVKHDVNEVKYNTSNIEGKLDVLIKLNQRSA